MFKSIKKQIRPNTSVQFWQGQNDPAMTDEFKNYFYENYVLTGRFISTTPEVSSDGLELTSTSIWTSEADHASAQADSVFVAGKQQLEDAYCAANGITNELIGRETF